MSALAARRAAQAAARADKPVKTNNLVSGSHVEVSKPKPSSQIPAQSPTEAGPSKRTRIATRTSNEPAIQVAESTQVTSNGPVTSKKRKRAFSPSAPAYNSGTDSSDEECGAGGQDVENGTVNDSSFPTPYGTPRPSRVSKPSNEKQIADSNVTFVKDRNIRKVSRAELIEVGLDNPGGDGILMNLSSKDGEYITLAGVFSIIALQNHLNFLSTTLQPSSSLAPVSIPVFAPFSHPLPTFKSAVTDMGIAKAVKSPLLDRLVPKGQLPNWSRDQDRTVFLILPNLIGIEGMRSGAVPSFSSCWGRTEGNMAVWGMKSVHMMRVDDKYNPGYAWESNESWESALDSLVGSGESTKMKNSSPPILLVKGAKRSGKSSLARSSLNRLLSKYKRVAWLECDLGQGEFGCGGVVGLWNVDHQLFGPPFTHSRIPERAHFMGVYTPINCPDEYLAAINDLIQHYRNLVQYSGSSHNNAGHDDRISDTVPLVVNTQGWVKGLGEDLMLNIENMVQPTHIFHLNGEVFQDNAFNGSGHREYTPPPQSHTNINSTASIFEIEAVSGTPLQARYNAAEFRSLSTLSYFHSQLPTSGTRITWDFDNPLVCKEPYEITLGEVIKAVYMLGEGAEGILAEDLHLALNGNIVALLSIDNVTEDEHEIYVQNRSMPPFEDSNCLGIGFVRSIQPVSDITSLKGTKIHLITPLAPSSLAKINAIARNGAMEMPSNGMVDWTNNETNGILDVPREDVPYFDVGHVGVGGEKRKWRRNIMRKGHFM